MNVGCPQCTSVFRVDPQKVPPGGVRARCSVCSGIINVPEPSMEEPVVPTGSTGWGGPPAPQWGRVNTPEGGWTPTPPVPRAASTPPAAAPPPSYTPPAAAPPPGLVWEAPAEPAAAGWGDWSVQTSGLEQEPAATQMPVSDPWAGFNANPLTPETPSYSPASAATPAYEGETEFESPSAEQAGATEAESGPAAEAEVDYGATAVPAAEEAAGQDEYAGEYRSAAVATPAAPEPAREAHVAAPATAGSPAETHVNPFLRRDPHERARRLARALASDIVVYYPDKHAEGLRDGNLRELFREEIKKSYDDYVAQVGVDLAQSTTYFQDALNEVLAGGKRLF